MITITGIIWPQRVASMRKRRGAYGTWWRNLSYIVHLEDKGVDGRIILRWIYKKQDGGVNWIDLAQIRRE